MLAPKGRRLPRGAPPFHSVGHWAAAHGSAHPNSQEARRPAPRQETGQRLCLEPRGVVSVGVVVGEICWCGSVFPFLYEGRTRNRQRTSCESPAVTSRSTASPAFLPGELPPSASEAPARALAAPRFGEPRFRTASRRLAVDACLQHRNLAQAPPSSRKARRSCPPPRHLNQLPWGGVLIRLCTRRKDPKPLFSLFQYEAPSGPRLMKHRPIILSSYPSPHFRAPPVARHLTRVGLLLLLREPDDPPRRKPATRRRSAASSPKRVDPCPRLHGARRTGFIRSWEPFAGP